MRERQQPRGSGFTVMLIVACPLVIVLYVLSVGPAYWLVCRETISPDVYNVYTGPARYLLMKTFPAYERYVIWWLPGDYHSP